MFFFSEVYLRSRLFADFPVSWFPDINATGHSFFFVLHFTFLSGGLTACATYVKFWCKLLNARNCFNPRQVVVHIQALTNNDKALKAHPLAPCGWWRHLHRSWRPRCCIVGSCLWAGSPCQSDWSACSWRAGIAPTTVAKGPRPHGARTVVRSARHRTHWVRGIYNLRFLRIIDSNCAAAVRKLVLYVIILCSTKVQNARHMF